MSIDLLIFIYQRLLVNSLSLPFHQVLLRTEYLGAQKLNFLNLVSIVSCEIHPLKIFATNPNHFCIIFQYIFEAVDTFGNHSIFYLKGVCIFAYLISVFYACTKLSPSLSTLLVSNGLEGCLGQTQLLAWILSISCLVLLCHVKSS